LHQGAGALGRCGLDEQVKVLGHQNPADEQKALLLPILPEKLDEQETEALARRGAALLFITCKPILILANALVGESPLFC